MSTPKPSHSLKSLKINSSLDASVSIRHSFSSSLPSSNGSERKPTAPRPEKRAPIVSKAAGLHQVQEDLARTRELLSLMEKSKSNLMHDLARAKRNIEDLNIKLLEKSKSHGDTIQSNKTDDDAIISQGNGNHQIEIDSMRDRYENALLEIEANKHTMEALKHELFVCIEAKDEAVRLAGEAMSAAESTSRRVSELSFELSRRTTRQNLPRINSSEIQLNEFTGELSVSFDESLLGCEELYGTSNQDDEFMVSEHGQITAIKNVFVEEKPETQISMELEEAQEKLLSLTLTEGVLISSFEFLKEKLERSQEKMKSREATASCEVEDMKSRLERMTIRNQEEMLMLKQKEASVLSDMEDLRVELSNHKSEIALMVEKEQAITANADALRKELDAKNQELIEHRKEWNDVIVALRMEVERIEAELVKQKERECLDSARIASLVCDLERQKAEGVDLQERLSEINGKYEAILALFHNDKMKLIELREREMDANGKIAALNTEVFELSKCLEESQRNGQVSQMEMVREKEIASLRFAALEGRLAEKQSEIEDLRKRLSEMDAKYMDISLSLPALATNCNVKGLELKERETNENAEIVIADADVYELKTALGNASRVGRISQEDWHDNAQVLLEKTVFEREKWRKEADIAEKVAQDNERIASDALLAGAQISKDDARRAVEAVTVVEEKSLTSVERAMEEVQLARKEAEEVKVVLQETMKSLEVASIEAEKAKDEARIARDELALIRIDSTTKNKGDERDISRKMSRDELLARNELESGVWEKQSREEVEEKESHDTNEEGKCVYDHNIGDTIISEEGMDSLKMKLKACERELEVAVAEAEALGLENKKLRMDLSVADSEREANKKAVVEANRSLVEMEKAKSVLEGDIQRLLDESKQRNALPETKDIPIHSNLDQNPGLECREEKPQPDPPQGEEEEEGNVINMGMMMTPLHMNKKGEMVDLDVLDPPQSTIVIGKKKKNPLLYRLHSYLDKKKNSHV